MSRRSPRLAEAAAANPAPPVSAASSAASASAGAGAGAGAATGGNLTDSVFGAMEWHESIQWYIADNFPFGFQPKPLVDPPAKKAKKGKKGKKAAGKAKDTAPVESAVAGGAVTATQEAEGKQLWTIHIECGWDAAPLEDQRKRAFATAHAMLPHADELLRICRDALMSEHEDWEDSDWNQSGMDFTAEQFADHIAATPGAIGFRPDGTWQVSYQDGEEHLFQEHGVNVSGKGLTVEDVRME